jgi:hypothetical protein
MLCDLKRKNIIVGELDGSSLREMDLSWVERSRENISHKEDK